MIFYEVFKITIILKMTTINTATINNSEIDAIFAESDSESDSGCCETQNQEIENNIETLFEKVKNDLIIADSQSESGSVEMPKTKAKKDKSQYVVNPLTKKDIKINGPKYRELIASGHKFEIPEDFIEAPKAPKSPTKRDKSQFVINPLTKKEIKINGPKYKELLASGHTFNLPENYTEIAEKIEKQTMTKGHDLEKEIFNEVTKRWCRLGSPSHKKMIELMKKPDQIIERKMIKGPSGRNIVIGGKTYLMLLKEGKIESPIDFP